MNAAIINMSVVFAAATAGILAVGMFIRDLLQSPEDPAQRRRLSLIPPLPQGGSIDNAFYRLVDESGVPFDNLTAMCLVIGCGIVGCAMPLAMTENFMHAAFGLLAGCIVPIVALSLIRWRRIANMRKHLPEALQVISDSVRGGQTLEEAFDLVSRDIKGPLGDEFAFARNQFQLGHTPLPIMARLVRRIPLQEFRVFATAVVVHRRAGGNLSLLTERMAHSARDRQEVRGHMLAATAGARLSAIGMVMGAVVAVCVLFWLEPDYIGRFFTHELGPTLLAVAGTLQVIGILWVLRLLRLNY